MLCVCVGGSGGKYGESACPECVSVCMYCVICLGVVWRGRDGVNYVEGAM